MVSIPGVAINGTGTALILSISAEWSSERDAHLLVDRRGALLTLSLMRLRLVVGQAIQRHEYVAPELFLLLMTTLFTFYHCLLSTIIFCRFHVIGIPHPTFTLPYLISSFLSLPYLVPYLTFCLSLPYLTLHLTLPYFVPYLTMSPTLHFALPYLTS